MRQFLLGGTAYPSGAVDESTAYGNVGFAYVDKSDNKMKFDADGSGIPVDGEGYLVLVRRTEDMGNVVLPLHKNHFSYVKGEYDRSSKKYSCYKYYDVNDERFFNGNKKVFVEFEF